MKYTIVREQAIPFRWESWEILQMIQHRVWVTVANENWETLEQVEEQADLILARNIEKTLSTDAIYQKQKNQLNFLVQKIKELAPSQARDIILAAKNINND